MGRRQLAHLIILELIHVELTAGSADVHQIRLSTAGQYTFMLVINQCISFKDTTLLIKTTFDFIFFIL